MDALISGTTGRALLVDVGQLKSFDVDDPSKLVSRRPSDFAYLFGEMRDLRVLENTDIESVQHELKHDSDCALALDLTLISLDPELASEIRKEAIEGLDELLTGRVVESLENILYARPLTEAADLAGASKLSAHARVTRVSALFHRLERYQPVISQVSAAWDTIPTKVFGSYDHQAAFQRVAAREGLFRSLVKTRCDWSKVFVVISNVSRNGHLKHLHDHRKVLQQWAASLIAMGHQFGPGLEAEEQSYERTSRELTPNDLPQPVSQDAEDSPIALPSVHTPETMPAARYLTDLLKQLSPEDQMLFDLTFDGYDAREIAVMLGISEPAVRKRNSRLMQKLRRLVQQGERAHA